MGERHFLESERNSRRRELSPKAVYADCIAVERGLQGKNRYLRLLLGDSLLSGRIFFDDPIGNTQFFAKLKEYGWPPNSMAARLPGSRPSKYEWRYRELIQILKQQADPYLRWIVIARWLKQEGVCEPEEFLPMSFRKEIAKRYRKKLPESPADLLNRALILNWKVYFERIREELEKRKTFRRAREQVKSLGFELGPIELTAKTRSDITAICQWLEERSIQDARSLRNSYSRLHSRPRNRSFEREMDFLDASLRNKSSME